MKKTPFFKLGMYIFGCLLFTSCGFDSVEKAGIKYSTKPAFELPANIQWQQVGTAKELINVKENLVVISDGDNAIPKEAWDDFKVRNVREISV